MQPRRRRTTRSKRPGYPSLPERRALPGGDYLRWWAASQAYKDRTHPAHHLAGELDRLHRAGLVWATQPWREHPHVLWLSPETPALARTDSEERTQARPLVLYEAELAWLDATWPRDLRRRWRLCACGFGSPCS